jgi:hypothetical protein
MITLVVTAFIASGPLSCRDVKRVYTENHCCGSPGKDLSPECNDVALGDATTHKLHVADKYENPFKGCIDSPTCWGMQEFLDGEFAKRTNGVGDDPSPYGGTKSQQLYPYMTAYTYHHGNTTMIESDMSKRLRRDNGGKNPLYQTETRMLTAMTMMRMFNSRTNLAGNWMKITDPVASVLPMMGANHRNAQMLRKLDGRSTGTFTYADLNAYGFLSVVSHDGLYCVRSTLPSGKTHDIDCTLGASDTLATSGPRSGVLKAVDYTTVDAKVAIGDLVMTGVNLNATCGIGKDPMVVDGTDLLSGMQEERYLNDATFGMTVVVPVGNEASYHVGGSADGEQFFYQVVQFKIVKQTSAITFRDTQTGRTGHGPSVLMPGAQLDFPKRYVLMSLSRYFYINAFQTIALDTTGRVGIMALFAAETDGMTDYSYLRALADTPLMYEPGTRFSEPIPGAVISQVAMCVLEESWTVSSFPMRTEDHYDYDTFNYGINALNMSASLEGIYRKYVMEPAGIHDDEYIVRTHDDADPRLSRIAPAMDPNFANNLEEADGVDSFNAILTSLGRSDMRLAHPPSDRVHGVVDIFEPIHNILSDIFGYTNPDLRDVPLAFRDVVQLGFFSQYYKPASPYFWTKYTKIERAGENMYISAEAVNILMKTLVNIGKTDSGDRVLACSEVGALFDPMDTTTEEIEDVSTYRDPPSAQADGKVSTTLGGVTAYEPDYKTYRNSIAGGAGTVIYESHQGSGAVASHEGQFSEVLFTTTNGFGPSWRFEGVWPGATYMREKFHLRYYLGRLCMPH